jgi:hypothetical protein
MADSDTSRPFPASTVFDRLLREIVTIQAEVIETSSVDPSSSHRESWRKLQLDQTLATNRDRIAEVVARRMLCNGRVRPLPGSNRRTPLKEE